MKTTLSMMALACLIISGCTKTAHRTTTTHHFISATSSSGSGLYMNDSTSDFRSDTSFLSFGGQCANGNAVVNFFHFTHTLGTFPIDSIHQFVSLYFRDFSGNTRVAHGTITLTAFVPDMLGTFTYTSTDSTVFTGSFNQPTP